MTLLDFGKQITPYYTSKHEEYRQHVRKWVENEITPNVDKWIKNGGHPNIRSYIKKMVNYGGLYTFPWGYGTWRNHKWDPFYIIIFHQEMEKHAFTMGEWIISMSVGPLHRYASNDTHKNALQQILNGDKLCALAISEMNAGSDVAQIKTTATKAPDGRHYIVNGNKYWITTGHRADYFVTLVRTGPISKGRNSVSLLLIPRCDGIYTSKIKLQGQEGNDTSAVTFKDVKVPIENLIYKENKGFIPLMFSCFEQYLFAHFDLSFYKRTNFNRERFIICCGLVSMSKLCVDEAIDWANERKTFGKKLIHHQVIRHKIANMSRRTLACQSFLERIAYQMMYDPYGEKDKSLARNVALCKVECSQTCQYCVIEASQIFGGRSYVRGGRGGKIDRIYRTIRAQAIAGGSEEIMLDLAMRQAKL